MIIIPISDDLKKAFCEGHRFDICEPISLDDIPELEALFPNPGVYIFHGSNSEILQVHKDQNSIGNDFKQHIAPGSNWKDSLGIERRPVKVSAIILDSYSAKFAGEIKDILKKWLNPIFK